MFFVFLALLSWRAEAVIHTKKRWIVTKWGRKIPKAVWSDLCCISIFLHQASWIEQLSCSIEFSLLLQLKCQVLALTSSLMTVANGFVTEVNKMTTFNILFALFLTLHLSSNIYITTSEPILECTKTTIMTLKLTIAVNLPLHQTVQYK